MNKTHKDTSCQTLSRISAATHLKLRIFCAITKRRMNLVVDQAINEYLDKRAHDYDIEQFKKDQK